MPPLAIFAITFSCFVSAVILFLILQPYLFLGKQESPLTPPQPAVSASSLADERVRQGLARLYADVASVEDQELVERVTEDPYLKKLRLNAEHEQELAAQGAGRKARTGSNTEYRREQARRNYAKREFKKRGVMPKSKGPYLRHLDCPYPVGTAEYQKWTLEKRRRHHAKKHLQAPVPVQNAKLETALAIQHNLPAERVTVLERTYGQRALA